jgi:hypothetical protein
MYKLTIDNSHDEKIVEEFNKVAKHFDNWDLLHEILSRYSDNEDIILLTEHLKDRLSENDIEFN